MTMAMATTPTLTTPATLANLSSTGKSFLDLPPEIRNNIYHQLFDGQEVKIRNHHCHDRHIGTNLIFTSKQCLQEARPVLLSTTGFNVDLIYMYTGRRGRSNSQTWPRSVQGFSEADLTLISKLELPGLQYSTGPAVIGLVFSRLSTMPWLRSLIIQPEDRYRNASWWIHGWMQVKSHICLLRYVVKYSGYDKVGKFKRRIANLIERAAQRSQHTPQFILKWEILISDSKAPTVSDVLINIGIHN